MHRYKNTLRNTIRWKLRKTQSSRWDLSPQPLCFTDISPLLIVQSWVAQWLEHLARYRGLWVQIPSGTFSSFQLILFLSFNIAYMYYSLWIILYWSSIYFNTHVTTQDATTRYFQETIKWIKPLHKCCIVAICWNISISHAN